MPMRIHLFVMPRGEPGNVLADFARQGRTFLLSEVLAASGSSNDISRAAADLWPLFTAYDLITERVRGDLRVRPKPPATGRLLTAQECSCLDAFFSDPSLPPGISESVLKYIEIKTGKSWNDPGVLQKIRKAIISQKSEYWKEGERKQVSYRKGYSVLGYLAYQAPVYILQAEHLVYDLALAGLLKNRMRVLDIGSGPGVVPLALADFLERVGGCTADIYSIEQSDEFIEAFRFLTGRMTAGSEGISIHPPIQADISRIALSDLPSSLDLVVFQNVLNEMTGLTLSGKASLVRECAGALSADGSILLAEPADMVNSTDLRRLALLAAGSGLFIHAPCRFLWAAPCTPDSCWSFVQKPSIRATELMEALASDDEGFRYRNTDIKYSYVLLRKVPPPKIPGLPLSPRGYARLSTLARHIDRRIHVAAVVMSGNLGDTRNYIFKICDGTVKRPVYAILPAYHVSRENKSLLTLPYGSVASFTRVLVRYNPRYKSYNLLVTRESGVGPLSASGKETCAHENNPKKKKGRTNTKGA